MKAILTVLICLTVMNASAEEFTKLTLEDFKEQLTVYCKKDNTCRKDIRSIKNIKSCDELQSFLDRNSVLIVDNDDQKGTVRDVVECEN